MWRRSRTGAGRPSSSAPTSAATRGHRLPPGRAGRLLPGSGLRAAARRSGIRHEPTNKIVLDLEKLYDEAGEDLAYVARYARAIQQQRGDYNGRVLSIRADDLRALAIVYDISPSGLIERLTEAGVLVADPRAFFAS